MIKTGVPQVRLWKTQMIQATTVVSETAAYACVHNRLSRRWSPLYNGQGMRRRQEGKNSNWPVVPILVRQIRNKLAKAKVRPNALLEGLEEQRSKLFRERYGRKS